jgi:hypothetical protein
MSTDTLISEAGKQARRDVVASVPGAARRLIGASPLSDQGIQAIVNEALSEVKGTVLEVQTFKRLCAAVLNPFDPQAENIQFPGHKTGTKLFHNMTTDTFSVPKDADRVVLFQDALGSARNGKPGIVVYFINSRLVSTADPQDLKDGCIVGSRHITTGFNAQLFSECSIISSACSIQDTSASQYKNGMTSAISYGGRNVFAPQMNPGKMGQLVERKGDYITNVGKNQRVIAVASNPGGMLNTFQQGRNQERATYKGAMQGAETYDADHVPNAGAKAIDFYSGTDNLSNYCVLAAAAQLSMSSAQTIQTFTVGTPPAIPIVPSYPASVSPVFQLWSSNDMPALTNQSSSTEAFLPRNCNAIRLTGTLRLGAPLLTTSCDDTSGVPNINVAQGIITQRRVSHVTPNKHDAEGIIVDEATYGVINSDGIDVQENQDADKGVNTCRFAGASVPVGGWLVNINVLSGTETNESGNVVDRTTGQAQLYAVMGTRNNVFYSCTQAYEPPNPTSADHTIVGWKATTVPVPVVTSESLGELNLNGIVVRPGMGVNYGASCRAESITGVSITMQAYDSPPWEGGKVRKLPCFNGKGGSVRNTHRISNADECYSVRPDVVFSPSPAGPLATARGYAIMNKTLAAAHTTFGAVDEIVLVSPGWGYLPDHPPTITFAQPGGGPANWNQGGGAPSVYSAIMTTEDGCSAQQFSVNMSNINGEFLRYDSNTIVPRQMIVMGGLIPRGTDGVPESNISISYATYMSGQLKPVDFPISTTTPETSVSNNYNMAQALAAISKQAPNLYANPISLDLGSAIFFSKGGDSAALHAASTGYGSGLFNIMKDVMHTAGKAFSSVKNAIASVDGDTRASISNLAQEPAAHEAITHIKNLVGLSHVPTGTILQGAEYAGKHLADLFGKRYSLGTDAPLYAASEPGAGFWHTLEEVGSVAMPLLLAADDHAYHAASDRTERSRTSSGTYGGMIRKTKGSTFPILNSDGTVAGRLNLVVTPEPLPARTYTTQTYGSGRVHIDGRFRSAAKGESQEAFNACAVWLREHPHIGNCFVSIKETMETPIHGRSWEASLASTLAGDGDFITGKIAHIGADGLAHIGPIIGASEKQKLSSQLKVPSANAKEAPNNPSVSVISVT